MSAEEKLDEIPPSWRASIYTLATPAKQLDKVDAALQMLKHIFKVSQKSAWDNLPPFTDHKASSDTQRKGTLDIP